MIEFNEQYRQQLINEHKLVSLAITQITDVSSRRFVTDHGLQAVDLAISGLRAKKVELEAKIDVLNDFIGS